MLGSRVSAQSQHLHAQHVLSCLGVQHVLLLQYTSSPGNHGSVKFFYARIADICMGVTITSIFTLIKPW